MSWDKKPDLRGLYKASIIHRHVQMMENDIHGLLRGGRGKGGLSNENMMGTYGR